MNPFFFGNGERRLYGIHEAPAAAGARTRAALLCHPWGGEYIHAHRGMRQLARKLSLAGFHTLRFDFGGTGDSAGEMADADLDAWECDAELALEELGAITQTRRAVLIGMRLGASIASRVAARQPERIEALVLWDPIVSGEDYFEEGGAAPADRGSVADFRGCPLTPRLRAQIESIDLTDWLASPPTRTLHVATPPGDVRPWIEDPENPGAIPAGTIQRIINWLA